MFFLILDRVLDLLTNPLMAAGFSLQFVTLLNDPPASLAGLFIALGLREMYVVYIKNSRVKTQIPAHDEIWETEQEATVAAQ